MVDAFDPNIEKSMVFHKNTDLFKRVNNSWEFFFRNTEAIRDIEPLSFGEHEGLFIISDSKITKWTNFVPAKNVYLKVRDGAGNESDTTLTCATVSLDLQAIKDFIPSGRIMDIDEYGRITYSFDSLDRRLFYGGDLIDTEIGTYESEILNGTNDLVSWRTINWISTEPKNTSISMQIRSGQSESEVLDADWSEDLIKSSEGFASIEFFKEQFIQYRAILLSRQRGISPTLHSVTIHNLTASSSHFFTTNFILPKRIVSGILTENSIIPVTADIVFGINTQNSVNFNSYQIIEPNRIFTTDSKQFGENLRVGVRFISPGIAAPSSQDPYTENNFSCIVRFDFLNTDVITKNFQFQVEFYNDVQRTQKTHEFFSGNNQTGWTWGNETTFPAAGLSIPSGSTRSISFTPGDNISSSQIYYLKILAYDGSSFEDVSLHDAFSCNTCSPEYDPYCEENIPKLKNFALIFAMEDGTIIKINDLQS